MKTITLFAVTLLAALVLTASQPGAQTYATSTTLAAAVTSNSATTIQVASASGFTVGYTAYIDHEAMSINAVTGTNITVFRGAVGTNGTTHGSGATVIVGPPAMFRVTDPPAGSCTPGNYTNLPIVNVITGDVWLCRYTAAAQTYRRWAATNSTLKTYNSLLLNLS